MKSLKFSEFRFEIIAVFIGEAAVITISEYSTKRVVMIDIPFFRVHIFPIEMHMRNKAPRNQKCSFGGKGARSISGRLTFEFVLPEAT